MQNQSGVNDEELNKMIASLRQEQQTSAPAGQVVNQPPAQPAKPAPAAPAKPTGKSSPAQPADPILTDVLAQPAKPAKAKSEPVTPPNVNSLGHNIDSGALGDIRLQVISELRPLVNRLDFLAPADKFDTLLLLIRTIDDSSLIPMAHQTAMAIPDEVKRAQALLDILKEIDFFTQKKG
mgnify:FL=1